LPHWWNTSVFDVFRAPGLHVTPTRVAAILSLGLLGVFASYFRRRPSIVVVYLGGSAMLMAIVYRTGHYLERYIGHLFILLVVAMWLVERERVRDVGQDRVASSRRDRAARFAFVAILACGTIAGTYTWARNVREPFTRNAEVAALLRSAHLDRDEIIGMDDFSLSPVAAQLKRQVYFPQMHADGSFAIWNNRRQERPAFDDLLEQFHAVVRRSGRHRAVLVLNTPVDWLLHQIDVAESAEPRPLTPGLTIRFLHHVPLGVVLGEEYFLYLIEEAQATNGAAP
jgi:hypothetical protein